MDCVFDFIVSKGLHHLPVNSAKDPTKRVSVKATGGGAYKFADEFQVGSHACVLLGPHQHPHSATRNLIQHV